MRNFASVIVATSVLAGCAFQKPEQVFIPKVVPTVRSADIRSKLIGNFKDPDSVMVRAGAPYLAYMNEGLAYGGAVTWQGYAVNLQLNGKNAFGAYVGYEPCIALYDEANLRRVLCRAETVLLTPVKEAPPSAPEHSMQPVL